MKAMLHTLSRVFVVQLMLLPARFWNMKVVVVVFLFLYLWSLVFLCFSFDFYVVVLF